MCLGRSTFVGYRAYRIIIDAFPRKTRRLFQTLTYPRSISLPFPVVQPSASAQGDCAHSHFGDSFERGGRAHHLQAQLAEPLPPSARHKGAFAILFYIYVCTVVIQV